MTVARTAIRLAVVQAISGIKDARPTVAEGRVYDSRISPEQPDEFGPDALPIVIVLTDGDDGDALSDQNGGPPFRRKIDLVLDIGMVCREKADADPWGYIIGYPDTDSRLEASLDALETQLWRILSVGGDPLAIWFQNHVRIWKHESHRQVEDDTAVKIARRLTTLTCEVNDDVYPVPLPGASALVGFDILPEPLRTVALLMPAGSNGLDVCSGIAAALGGTPFRADFFKAVDLTVDAVGDQAAEHEAVASANTGQ